MLSYPEGNTAAFPEMLALKQENKQKYRGYK